VKRRDRRSAARDVQSCPEPDRRVAGPSPADDRSTALETLGTQVRFHEDAEMSARGAAVLGAIMTGVSLQQASRQLGDRTWTAAPDTADLERGRVLIARYRQASDTALSWLKRTAHGF